MREVPAQSAQQKASTRGRALQDRDRVGPELASGRDRSDGIEQARALRNPQRQTAELRKGRVSIAGASYFVTFGTAQRAPTLAPPAALLAAHAVCLRLVQDGDVSALTATVMPDHVHLLFRLGDTLALDRVVAKWRTLVRRSAAGLDWQANFFEHRLRPDEETEPYAWYIFMNPYRAGLIGCDEPWSGWWTDDRVVHEFLTKTRPGPCPQPGWLEQGEKWAGRIVTGEE